MMRLCASPSPAARRMSSCVASPYTAPVPLPASARTVSMFISIDGAADLVLAEKPRDRPPHRSVAHHHGAASAFLPDLRVGRPRVRPRPQPSLDEGNRPEQERVGRDRENRRADDGVARRLRHDAQLRRQRGDDERELPDLSERGGHRRGPPARAAGTASTIANAASGLPSMTTASVAAIRVRPREHARRVQQHPDRDEEQHRERVPHRQRVGRGPEAEVRPADDEAGEERAEGHRHAEELRRRDGDAERRSPARSA